MTVLSAETWMNVAVDHIPSNFVPNIDLHVDSDDETDVQPVTSFSKVVTINRNHTYKIPSDLATLARLEHSLALNVKVPHKDVSVIDVIKEKHGKRNRFIARGGEASSQNMISIMACGICFTTMLKMNAWCLRRWISKSVRIFVKRNAEVEGIDKPQAVIVIGTIRVVNNHWYYMGCNHCTKKVESSLQPLQLTEGESGPPAEVVHYYCKGDICTKLCSGFLMTLEQSTLTLFDGEAKKIIKKSALDVFENFTPPKENPFQLPPEIEYLIEKKYAFKFLVSADHIAKRFTNYTIMTLTSDPDIIRALEDKSNAEENSALIEVEDATGATSSQKNVHKVVSISDDNITPVSNALKAVNEMEHSEGLKRNLDQVYDNEEVADVSSSKSRSSGSEKEATVTVKMLVPKKEK
ncbi:hypothetical protein SSX86_001960 [Deinandra increscens subsp. villosa]|uniref:Uncharacterized protein n=1 Tax=Deinandra increscens subsp. villosa TaxID=3103831 RepID=A0AAP0DVG9_9ASTR